MAIHFKGRDGGIVYELNYATKIAERLVGIVRPWCKQVMIAGSIRRMRPDVKDIDLVVIPTGISGFGMALLRKGEILNKKRIDSKTKIIKYRFQGMPAEIYIANEETWPMLVLVRTGSKSHNQRLAMHAQGQWLRFKADGQGILDSDGRKLSGDTEESIFEALGLPWVPPEQRE